MLKKFFEKKDKPQAPEKSPGLSSGLASTILNTVGAKSIPPMPGAAQKAFELATDPGAQVRDFLEVIESDEAQTARVVKIANSVYFDRGKKSKTIDEAVAVIGINELRCLLNASSLSEIFPSKHPLRAALWANDIATALISKELAQQIIPAKADLAFLGGLMHDVGKLLLLQRCSDEYLKVLRQVEIEGLPFCEAEVNVFPFDHTEVGQLIAERWNFDTELQNIIRNHHADWQTLESPGFELVRIVKAADQISHALGLGHPRGYSRLQSQARESLPETWLALGATSISEREALKRYETLFASEYDLYSSQAT